MREFLAQHQAKLSTLAFLTLGGAFILSLIVNLGTPIIGGVFVASEWPSMYVLDVADANQTQ